MSPQTGTLYWLPVILGDTTLDPTETLLMVGLADHVNADDVCWVGIARLAAYARVSYGTARRRLATLEDRGVIARSQRKRADGGDSVYEYQLLRPEPPAQSSQGPPRNLAPAPRAPGRASPPARPGARAEPPIVEPPSGEPTPRAESVVLAAGFDRFWTAYPRATAKGDARKAWPAAVKAAGGIEAVVAGAERYRGDPNRDDRFTKHPATWLRAECWADPPLPPRGDRPNHAKVAVVDSDRGAPAGRLNL